MMNPNVNADYVELLCSLPYLQNPFVRQRPPISVVQFSKRLKMLDFEARQLVDELAGTFYWARLKLDDSDADLVRKATRIIEKLEFQDMKTWQMWRMDFRTVITALRRRKQGLAAPDSKTLWGYGHYVSHIRRHWNHPTFKLETRFPWLPEAKELLEAGDSYGLERHLMTTAWEYYSRQEADKPYSLSDVWLYAVKWDLVDRWCCYNADTAKQHFEELVQAGLKQPMEELRAMV